MSLLEISPIDLTNVCMLIWEILYSRRDSEFTNDRLKTLQRVLCDKTAVKREAVQQIITDLSRSTTERETTQLIAKWIKDVNGATMTIGSQAHLIKQVSEMRKHLEYIRRVFDESSAYTAPSDVDVCAALAVAQASHVQLSRAFASIPLGRLYVNQWLVSVANGSEHNNLFSCIEDTETAIVVRAPFGHGKSTLLRMVAALKYPIPSTARATLLPLYLPAARVAGQQQIAYWQRINAAIQDMYGVDVGDVRQRISQSTTLLLMIDGFDEVPRYDDAAHLLEQSLMACDDAGGRVKLVLAGRDRFFESKHSQSLLQGYATHQLMLKGFTERQQDSWIRLWNGYCREQPLYAPMKAKDIKSTSGKRRGIYSTPLVLMLHALVKDRDGVARDTSLLYERIIDLTISGKALDEKGTILDARGLADRVSGLPRRSFSAQVRRRVLQEAAYQALRHGDRSVPYDKLIGELEGPVKAELRKLVPRESQYDARKDLELAIKSPSQLLVDELSVVHFFEQDGGLIRFVHQSFVDYLCAERYLRNNAEDVNMNKDKSRHITPDVESFVWSIAYRRRQHCPLLADFLTDSISVEHAKLSELLRLRHVLMHSHPTRLGEVIALREDLLVERADEWDDRHHKIASRLQSTLCLPGRAYLSASFDFTFLSGTFVEATFSECAFIEIGVQNGVTEISDIDASEVTLTYDRCSLVKTSWRGCATHLVFVSTTVDQKSKIRKCKIWVDAKDTTFNEIEVFGSVLLAKRLREVRFINCKFMGTVFEGDWGAAMFEGCSFESCEPVGFASQPNVVSYVKIPPTHDINEHGSPSSSDRDLKELLDLMDEIAWTDDL